MDKRRVGKETCPTIHDLYPHLNEAQQKEAEENLSRYLELVLKISERLEVGQEPPSGSIFDSLKNRPYDDPKGSIPA